MDVIQDKLHIINELLTENARAMNSGLLNGKMGVCIYFFHLAGQTENDTYQQFAEKLLEDVIESVKKEINRGYPMPDFENGLAGIAWGIEYLKQQEFIKGDSIEILSDIDHKLYQYIISTYEEMPAGISNGIMGYMLYLLFRLDMISSAKESIDEVISKRLLIDLTNQLGESIEHRKCKFEEPLVFDLCWDLPVCLVLLAKIRSLNIYNTKTDRILDHLSPIVLSFHPRLMGNRLYLLFGMESVLKQIDMPGWKKHTDLLQQTIHMNGVLSNELKNNNIHFLDGAAGLAWITRRLFSITGDHSFLFNKEELQAKMINSEYWEDLEEDEIKRRNLGFISGLTGIGIELIELLKDTTVKVED